jgi:hypothetical protein
MFMERLEERTKGESLTLDMILKDALPDACDHLGFYLAEAGLELGKVRIPEVVKTQKVRLEKCKGIFGLILVNLFL